MNCCFDVGTIPLTKFLQFWWTSSVPPTYRGSGKKATGLRLRDISSGTREEACFKLGIKVKPRAIPIDMPRRIQKREGNNGKWLLRGGCDGSVSSVFGIWEYSWTILEDDFSMMNWLCEGEDLS
jgi:hypothetical protein